MRSIQANQHRDERDQNRVQIQHQIQIIADKKAYARAARDKLRLAKGKLSPISICVFQLARLLNVWSSIFAEAATTETDRQQKMREVLSNYLQQSKSALKAAMDRSLARSNALQGHLAGDINHRLLQRAVLARLRGVGNSADRERKYKARVLLHRGLVDEIPPELEENDRDWNEVMNADLPDVIAANDAKPSTAEAMQKLITQVTRPKRSQVAVAAAKAAAAVDPKTLNNRKKGRLILMQAAIRKTKAELARLVVDHQREEDSKRVREKIFRENMEARARRRNMAVAQARAATDRLGRSLFAASKASKTQEQARTAARTELAARQRGESYWANKRVDAAKQLAQVSRRLANAERDNAQAQFRARMPRAPWHLRFVAEQSEKQFRRIQSEVQRAKVAVDVATVRSNQNKARADEMRESVKALNRKADEATGKFNQIKAEYGEASNQLRIVSVSRPMSSPLVCLTSLLHASSIRC